MYRRTGDSPGYARDSTPDQDISGRVESDRQISAVRMSEDAVSGKSFDRPGVAELCGYAWPGHSLADTRLDGLGCSLRELLAELYE